MRWVVRLLAVLLLGATCGLSSPGYAEITHLSSEHFKNVLELGGDINVITTAHELPKSIISLCAGGKGKMLNPNEEWGAFDLVMDGSVPTLRLIWAVVGGGYAIVHYEKGGVTRSLHVMIASFSPEKKDNPEFIWRAVSSKFGSFEEFQAALGNRDLDDTSEYQH